MAVMWWRPVICVFILFNFMEQMSGALLRKTLNQDKKQKQLQLLFVFIQGLQNFIGQQAASPAIMLNNAHRRVFRGKVSS